MMDEEGYVSGELGYGAVLTSERFACGGCGARCTTAFCNHCGTPVPPTQQQQVCRTSRFAHQAVQEREHTHVASDGAVWHGGRNTGSRCSSWHAAAGRSSARTRISAASAALLRLPSSRCSHRSRTSSRRRRRFAMHHTTHYTPHTPHSALHTPHFTLHSSHSALHTPRPAHNALVPEYTQVVGGILLNDEPSILRGWGLGSHQASLWVTPVLGDRLSFKVLWHPSAI